MDDIDWTQLKLLRQAFLEAEGFLPDYWRNDALVHAYEQTLAQRIAWKWDAVLDALRPHLKEPLELPRLIDWGCGSGIATRRVLASGLFRFGSVSFYDRSPRALRYARDSLREQRPKQRQTELLKPERIDEPFGLIVSHVLSELPAADRDALVALCRRASLVIWVEAGRSQESRLLSSIREELRQGQTIIAPCPHQNVCGMLMTPADWCHFFAPVPAEVFRSAFWRQCSQQLGFDLRSLPVSYLVSAKPDLIAAPDAQNVRVLEKARTYKGFRRWTACHDEGILTGDYAKRRSRALYEQLGEPGLDAVVALSTLRSDPE